MQYWGFDLGDGESTLARVSSEGKSYPEIVEVEGNKVIITVWAIMRDGEVRIGDNAARSAAAAVRSAARFKRRFLNAQSDSAALIRDFSARVFESLRGSGELVGGEKSNSVYVGCPAGWNAEARERYQRIFETIGFPTPHVVSESRAVMVGAIQSNSVRDVVDLRRKTVLVADIGSSTTDFAYIKKGKEAEIRTGGEVRLGGGVMDETLLEACVSASPHAAALRRVFAESESWRVDSELKARRLKERYFSGGPAGKRKDCAESLLIRYDEPLLLDLVLDEKMAARLTDGPCRALGGRSFREVFCAGLREVRRFIGEEQPELLFLTGGVSRMSEIRTWCAEIFPEAVIYVDAEPEFSVAKGLAWCGRIDDELALFRADVEALIGSDAVESIVRRHLRSLYDGVLERMLDPMLDKAVKPVLLDWREGRLETLRAMEDALRERIKVYLHSDEARGLLYQPVSDWMARVSEDLEAQTSPICRRWRVPDQSLKISSHLAASDLHILENVDAKSLFAGDALAGAAFFVESVVSVVVGLLCGGSGMALVAEGPVGIAIGVISSLLLFTVGHLLGKDAVDEKLMTMNLPRFLRRAALAEVLPKLEKPGLSLPQTLKDASAEPKGALPMLHLLPKLKWPDSRDIPERRMRAIRRKVKAGYDGRLADEKDEAVQALNARMCREIAEQIEQRLKELAEQVEIPL